MDIHEWLGKERHKLGLEGPHLTTARLALRGRTHRRGTKEARGAKPKLTPLQVRRLNAARVALMRKANNEGEVHISHAMGKARVTHVAEATVSKHFKAQLGICWRAPRGTPLRQPEDEAERVRVCSKWKYLPAEYFTHRVDAIIGNKKFSIATYPRAKRYMRMRRVRGHLRTRAEGIHPHFTKPKSDKGRVNPGAAANVCAAIISGKVMLWH